MDELTEQDIGDHYYYARMIVPKSEAAILMVRFIRTFDENMWMIYRTYANDDEQATQ